MSTATITRQDTKSGRWYTIDGRRLRSVTSILQAINKPALIQWAANEERLMTIEAAADLYEDIHATPKMSRPTFVATLNGRIGTVKAHQKLSSKAQEIGSQTHSLIEWNLRRLLGQKVGPEPKIEDKAMWAFMSWQDWAKRVSLKPIYIEQTVFSLIHGYAGTMDLLAEVEDVVTLIDWVTGKAVYGEKHLQVAAYYAALAEMGHTKAEAGLIVRLPKIDTDPAFEAVPVPTVNELFPVFLAVKEVAEWWFAQEQASRKKWEAKKGAAAA